MPESGDKEILMNTEEAIAYIRRETGCNREEAEEMLKDVPKMYRAWECKAAKLILNSYPDDK